VADDVTVNEIADSPSMWWGVQRQITEGKSATRSPWPPITKFWRLLMIGVPTTVAAMLLVSFFVLRPSVSDGEQAYVTTPATDAQTASSLPVEPKIEISTPINEVFPGSPKAGTKTLAERKMVAIAKRKTPDSGTQKAAAKSAEIKTEFIALSYARNPESGQIVRVKVPKSMMVTLGLVASVEKPSSLVNAEVVVGDDGMTHAIRFIR